MPRIAALDVGDATVGVAVTDELCMTVNPVTTIHRTGSIKADVRAVESLLEELRADEVVIGLPLTADGEIGPQAQKVIDFRDRLARRLRIEVVTWDERFSTVEAEQLLLEADVSRRKRRDVIDAMAAVVILRSYLNSRSSTFTADRRPSTDDSE